MKKIMCGDIDIFDSLNGNLDLIIEYFVKFYGESDREFITKRLKEDTTYFFLPKMGNEEYNTINYTMNYYDKKVNEVFSELDKKFNVNLEYGVNPRVKPNEMQIIKKKLLSGEELSERELTFVKTFAEQFKIPLKTKLFQVDVFTDKTVTKIAEKIDEYCQAYKSEFGIKVATIMGEKLEVQHLLTSTIPDPQLLKSMAESSIEERALECFVTLLKSRNIEFNKDAHMGYLKTYIELARLGRLYPYATPKQETEYVEFFKFLGIEGDSYSNYYAKFYTFRDIVIDKDLQIFIGRKYGELQDKKINGNAFLTIAEEKAKSLDMKYARDFEDMVFLFQDYVYNTPKTGAYISAYLDSNNELKYICVFSDYFGLTTDCVIHEMNHLLETVFLGEDSECYYTKSGFDIMPHAKNRTTNIDFSNFLRGAHRSYETFSEIINEYISYKIYTMMKEDGVSIGGNSEKTSYYKYGFCAFYRLIEENLDVLIECRRSNEQYKLADYISPIEYEELAGIAEELLYANFFDIKSATSEILANAKRPLLNEMELARLIRTKKIFNRVKWSDNVKLLAEYTKKIDLIADTIKEASSSSKLDASINIKKIADADKGK